jgi:hypothetical protein
MKETSAISDEGTSQPKTETYFELIGDQILHALGRPPSLCGVQVRALWGNKYRVNVYAGDSIVSAKITDSFFVATGSQGRIVETTPAVTRQY